MSNDKKYYVYVYIDPRNFQEFYYGKGIGDRIDAHMSDMSDSSKAKTIREIKDAGLEPIRRVVVKELSESEALLVEKTLIWKLGRNLTNKSMGHFSSNFRPHDSLHRSLYGFDYENGLFYVNVGEGDHRSWDDCRKYGFLSAGQDWHKWGRKMYNLKCGDVVAAYWKNKKGKGRGYVGIGIVISEAVPAIDFKVKGRPISQCELVQPRICKVEKDIKEEEHIIGVKWVKSLPREKALWEKGLFANQNVVASLDRQQQTVDFLEEKFAINFDVLLNRRLKAS